MKFKLLLLWSACFFAGQAFATHNRAGEIEFRQIGPLEVEASVITYTNANSMPGDRDSLTVCWGDGNFSRVPRVNGLDINGDGVPDGEIIAPGIKMNIYRDTHLYAEINRYTIGMTDPNRNGGIININFPNSENVKFHLQSEIQLEEDFLNNNSPILLEPPYGIGLEGQTFMHVPNAFDIDDDSISYQLITPLQDKDLEVPNYIFPNLQNPGPDNMLTLDEETGALVWNAPPKSGEYVFTILITSYREGVVQDKIIRDFTVLIEQAPHMPPSITATENHPEVIHVAIGDTVSVEVSTSSLNDTVLLNLTATCGLFEDFYENNPTFVSSVDGNEGDGTFEWIVQEEHLRQQPYQLVFRSQDNFLGEGLPWFHVLRYRVVTTVSVSPPPAKNFKVNVYPNPASDFIRVEMKEAVLPQPYILQGMNGKAISTGRLERNHQQIDVAHLPRGSYLLNFPELNHAIKVIR
jgi:hypothetical protein